MNGKEQLTCHLHQHMLDQNDSGITPAEVCRKAKELGAKAVSCTQHGVMTAHPALIQAGKDAGLKVLLGIETGFSENGLVEDGNDMIIFTNEHLVLLAMNTPGYTQICRAVSDLRSQNSSGKAVMNMEVLKDYFAPGTPGHGNVIALSACINGVVAMKLRANEKINREVEKVQNKLGRRTVDKDQLHAAEKKLAELEAALASKKEERDMHATRAKMKFAKREKMVAKMQGKEKEQELKKLEEEKANTEKAIQALEAVKKEIAGISRQITAAKKDLKALSEKAEKSLEMENRIRDLESMKRDEAGLYQDALQRALEMNTLFGDGNFYMEVQYHGIDVEADVYPKLAKIAREQHIPIVATNDVHTIDNSPDELLKRQILRAMRFQQWEAPSVGDDQLYMKTDAEMADWLRKILPEEIVQEAMHNIGVIVDRCNVSMEPEKHYPVFSQDSGKSADQILVEEIRRGIAWRFPNGLPDGYADRLNYEYHIIKTMGYSDYHLIVKDFLEYGRILAPVPDDRIAEAPLTIAEAKKWVKENGWTGGFTIGPGRGSAAGSLVCYCLGITSLDPIKYNLLFERFLNPERISMPDIDSDIAKRIRPKVIEYVKAKYGKDAVCGIMTMNAVAPRGVIRDAARIYAMSLGKEKAFLQLSDEMAKKVPEEPGISFGSEYGDSTVYEYLRKEYESNKDAIEILRWAKVMEGYFKTYGAHAAGIVISDGKPVSTYVPLMWNDELKEMVTQVDMNHVEERGLIKMDFLGLKTLDLITDCIRMIKDRTGKVIDPLTDIPMDDPAVFREIFQKGRTNSVFQFESDGMKNMLKRFKPDTFEDLIILVSMFRPGPLQYLDGVIDVKNGIKPVEFLTPELEPILGKTYGAIVYQEEVMEIFQKLAGYMLGGADQVRRYMSKKKMGKLIEEKEAFIHGDVSRNIRGCVASGIREDLAEELFEQMTDFAKYAFNKSHAAAYAWNSYITAWFKLHYTKEFLAAAMKWADKKKIVGLVHEAKGFGISVLPPDINRSAYDFTVTAGGEILFGLSAVKSVGTNAEDIILARKAGGTFQNLYEFFKRSGANKAAVESLIWAGAFDALCHDREYLASVFAEYKETVASYAGKESLVKDLEKYLPYANDVETEEELAALLPVLEIAPKSVTKPEKADKVEKRISMAKKDMLRLSECLQEYRFDIPSMTGQKNYMAKEKDLLGAYISGHPLDDYDAPEQYKAISMSEAKELRKKADHDTKVTLLAVINSIKSGISKNGNAYAILDAEDKNESSVKICLFGKTYTAYKDRLEEGAVFLFTGSLQEDGIGSDEEDEMSYSLILDSLQTPAKRGRIVVVEYQNLAAWRADMPAFREKYEADSGYMAELYLKDEDKIYGMPWRVKETICQKAGTHLR